MTKYTVTVTFFEPFRLWARTSREIRELLSSRKASGRNRQMRELGYARLFSIDHLYYPAITGTLLRSRALREIEEILARAGGSWMDHPCCPGEFLTTGQGTDADFRRHRATPRWDSGLELCSDHAERCVLCRMLGRLTPGSGPDKQRTVRFGNLLPDEPGFDGLAGVDADELSTIGRQRILNRRDLHTGKAGDTFSVWEIDEILHFRGELEIAEPAGKPDREVYALVKSGLAMIGSLCGATCEITLAGDEDTGHPDDHVDLPISEDADRQSGDQYLKDLVDLADRLQDEGAITPSRLRELADGVLALRGRDPNNLALPGGIIDRDGQQQPHFLWDKNQAAGQSVRDILTNAAEEADRDGLNWRAWCEQAGHRLFRLAKKAGGNGLLTAKIRPLGAAHQSRQPDPPDNTRTPGILSNFIPEHEWIITGTLRAMTPFHIGCSGGEDSQVDLPVLLDRTCHFYLPRSSQRGALREYLHYATENQGCSGRLGLKHPCQCAVCRVMRRIQVLDSKSDTTLAPDIRQRIRKDPDKGIVDKGALFSMETGPQGTTFPFSLRWRGEDPQYPDYLNEHLETILLWWQAGYCFIGGQGGTGKGRFRLEDIRVWRWDLVDGRHDYVSHTGLRNPRKNIAAYENNFLVRKGIDTTPSIPEFPLQKVSWRISFAAPILSADPVAALTEAGEGDSRASDALFFRKTVLEDGAPVQRYALKGESIRGLLRHGVGKSDSDKKLLLQTHQDCDCLLCALFGNEHHQGKIRIEDLELENDPPQTKIIDNVSIDRFDHSVVQKFDKQPIVATPDSPVTFKGTFWLAGNLEPGEREALSAALQGLADGLHPVGGHGAEGLGWIDSIDITNGPQWLTEKGLGSRSIPKIHEPDRPETETAEPLDSAKHFNPYYFLQPPDQGPRRTHALTGHAFFDPTRRTGRIRCRLTTLTPLVVPDTSNEDFFNLQKTVPGHRNHGFFRLNGSHCIPGSTIRGMVSSVYEPLTNSCFRVMDQKKRVTRRMDAKNPDGIGRLVRRRNQWQLWQYKKASVLFYADPNLTQYNLSNEQLCGEQEVTCWVKEYNYKKILLKDITQNRNNAGQQWQQADIIRENGNLLIKIGRGREPIFLPTAIHDLQPGECWVDIISISRKFTKARFEQPQDDDFTGGPGKIFPYGPAENIKEVYKILRQGHTGWLEKRGLLFVTGPDTAEIQHTDENTAGYPPLPQNILDIPSTARNPFICRDNTDSSILYSMPKKNEIFAYDFQLMYPVADEIVQNYRQVLDAYDPALNPQVLPAIFRSIPVNNYFANGKELPAGGFFVHFFKNAQNQIVKLAPVAISKTADPEPMAAKLDTPHRPCAHVCLDEGGDCDECTAKTCTPAFYREGNPIDGLCPACHLFGATGYKGRVRFGYGFFDQPARFQNRETGGNNHSSLPEDAITLPLLERPRPTWALRTPEDRIPGRKFYVHNGAWTDIVQGKTPHTNEPVLPNSNNTTVQAAAPEQRITFDIFYENLDELELGTLLYSLELEPGLAHKMGKGKPLGLGSVVIEVIGLKEYRADGAWADCPPEQWHDLKTKAVETLQQIIDNGVGENGRSWQAMFTDLKKYLRFRQDTNIHYPALETRQQDRLPGYKELKQTAYNPNDRLKIPFDPWAS